MSQPLIGVLNGPNLGRLGTREPDVYGSDTLADLEDLLHSEAEEWGVEIECVQTNHEGAAIDQIEHWAEQQAAGLIVNAGAWTHTSVALRDAIKGSGLRAIEVHLSNVHQRESFRHHSYLSGVCEGVIAGLGFAGYMAALRFLAERD